MTFTECLSSADLQTFAFPRRELLQKLFSVAVATAAVKRSPKLLVFKNCSPKFNIGDLVAEDYLDEWDQIATDFGEVVGFCLLPKRHLNTSSGNWVYFIYWTHSTCGVESCYPCYDGQPTNAEQLRLV